jgi:zinc and cadmium transporter
MSEVTLYAILASVASSLLGLVGGFFLLWKHRGLEKVSTYLVSFAAGAMLAATFYDLLPETIAASTDVMSIMNWMLFGFLLFFAMEKLLLWHHHAHPHEHHSDLQTTSRMIALGDGVHNAIDGIIIGVAFLTDIRLGVITSVAVFLHEIPSELGDFSVMIAAGLKRRTIIWWNVIGALISPVATAITMVTVGATQSIQAPLLALASGTFLYIVSADLIPQIHRDHRVSRTYLQLFALLLGMILVAGVGRIVSE